MNVRCSFLWLQGEITSWTEAKNICCEWCKRLLLLLLTDLNHIRNLCCKFDPSWPPTTDPLLTAWTHDNTEVLWSVTLGTSMTNMTLLFTVCTYKPKVLKSPEIWGFAACFGESSVLFFLVMPFNFYRSLLWSWLIHVQPLHHFSFPALSELLIRAATKSIFIINESAGRLLD